MRRMWVTCLLLLSLSPCLGVYLPGVVPKEYTKGEEVTIKVNSISSVKTAMPYDYYSLMFCRPAGGKGGRVPQMKESLGELLWGDAIKPSRYQAKMLEGVRCKKLCKSQVSAPKIPEKAEKKTGVKNMNTPAKPDRQIKKLKARIDDSYRGHLILDNLPVAETFIWERGSSREKGGMFYRRGYPIGIPGNSTSPSQVYNHLAFTVRIHKPVDAEGDVYRIVGFTVEPYSVDSDTIESKCESSDPDDWNLGKAEPQYVAWKPHGLVPPTKSIWWSYSVRWVKDPEVAWSSRWDVYLRSSEADNPRVHWFFILNSLLGVLILAGVVTVILLRTLHKDFNKYKEDESDGYAEETGWKLVHADVFRPPVTAPTALSVCVGTGIQILGMAVVTLVFACLGYLSPAQRGALMKWMLVSYAVMGVVGGFVTGMLVNTWKGTGPKPGWGPLVATGLRVPGCVFVVFFTMNLILWSQSASSAVPFTVLLVLVTLWFCVTVPAVVVGGMFAYRLPVRPDPQSTNGIPRQIPPKKWYMTSLGVKCVPGVIPFLTTMVELSFILSSLWLNRIYHVFGFLAVVFGILLITCALTSVVVTYFVLLHEDYHWWWPAFMASGSAGIHLFVYSVGYLVYNLHLANVLSMVVYMGYMATASALFGLMTGAVGFLTSYEFVRYIYAHLRVD